MTEVLEIVAETIVSDNLIQDLKAAYYAGNRHLFATYARGSDWSMYSPDELIWSIKTALQLELPSVAIMLAKRGQKLFPNNVDMQHTARTLASSRPPHLVEGEPIKGFRESQEWLQNYARAYQGKWIAVNKGKLIGVAQTLKALDEMVAQAEDPESTFIQKVAW